jgi:hypothetical protein
MDRWDTNAIHVAPTFSGSLSAISSALIIYVILRSETRLSSVYHRIMFGMSIADVLSSTAVALSTLPMPSYMPQEEELEYRWTAGTRLGNTSTCNAQGFLQSFGMLCMFNYNAMLCVYYACAIAFTMQENNIKKYVEPVLHGFPIVTSLALSLYFLWNNLYNPQMGHTLPFTSWCAPSGYPLYCGGENEECIRGFDVSKIALITTGVTSGYCLLTIVISLTMVLRKVILTENMLYHGSLAQVLQNIQEFREKHTNTKVVFVQATFYVVAFLMSVSPSFIRVIAHEYDATEQVLENLFLVSLLFLPLQGFFNFVIFVSHKVYNYRRVNKIATVRHVIWLLFFTAAHEPYFISRISIIQDQEDSFDDENIDKKNIIEIITNDEGSSNSMIYRLSIMDRGEYNIGNDTSKVGGNLVQCDEKGSVNDKSISIGSSGLSFKSPDTSISYPSASPFSVGGELESRSEV